MWRLQSFQSIPYRRKLPANVLQNLDVNLKSVSYIWIFTTMRRIRSWWILVTTDTLSNLGNTISKMEKAEAKTCKIYHLMKYLEHLAELKRVQLRIYTIQKMRVTSTSCAPQHGYDEGNSGAGQRAAQLFTFMKKTRSICQNHIATK